MIEAIWKCPPCACFKIIFKLSARVLELPFKLYLFAVNFFERRFFTCSLFRAFLDCEANLFEKLETENRELKSVDRIVNLIKLNFEIRTSLHDLKEFLNTPRDDAVDWCGSLENKIQDLNKLSRSLNGLTPSGPIIERAASFEHVNICLARLLHCLRQDLELVQNSDSSVDFSQQIQSINDILIETGKGAGKYPSFDDLQSSRRPSRLAMPICRTKEACEEMFTRDLSFLLVYVERCYLWLNRLKEEFVMRFEGRRDPISGEVVSVYRIFNQFLPSFEYAKDLFIELDDSLRIWRTPFGFIAFLFWMGSFVFCLNKGWILASLFCCLFSLYKIIALMLLGREINSIITRISNMETMLRSIS
ncbi:hypothetical protein [Candidatus Similichlamydia epinepheli]|uniref:hypothetical protein n=1 Tax=Candidatus Similichlamydia epinepheli TaxID=1903953 RepID=UPI000D384977|nr:hypothetical protein [Candidatus Similichlamydia epinepheli]